MCPRISHLGHDLVALGDQVLYGVVKVMEGCADFQNVFQELAASSDYRSDRTTEFDIGSDDLINKVKIPAVPQLGVISLYHLLVAGFVDAVLQRRAHSTHVVPP
jgi:hypothetical protein